MAGERSSNYFDTVEGLRGNCGLAKHLISDSVNIILR